MRKQISFLLFILSIFFFNISFSLNNLNNLSNLNYKLQDEKLSLKIYQQVKSNFIPLKKEPYILSNFLAMSHREPSIEFIKKIISEYKKHNIIKSLFNASRKQYWAVVDYIFHTFFHLINHNDLMNFFRIIVRYGRFNLIKKFFVKGGFEFEDEFFVDTLMLDNIKGHGSVEIAKLLIKSGAKVSKSLFFNAIKFGSLDLVEFFIKRSKSIKLKLLSGDLVKKLSRDTPLHVAVLALKNNIKMINFFIDKGLDIYSKNSSGHTPLESLLFYKKSYFTKEDLLVVKFLLGLDGYYANEVNISFIISNSNIDYYKEKILQYIKKAQTEAILRNNKKYTLSNLIYNKNIILKSVKQLIVQEPEQDYSRAFISAIYSKRIDLVKYFISLGIKVEEKELMDDFELKALSLAVCQGHLEMVKEILEFIETISEKELRKLIKCAVERGYLDILNYLLSNGGDTLVDISETILLLAIINRQRECIKKFKDKRFSSKILKKVQLIAVAIGDLEILKDLHKGMFGNKLEIFKKALKYKKTKILEYILKDLKYKKLVNKQDIYKYFLYKNKMLNKNDEEIFNVLLDNKVILFEKALFDQLDFSPYIGNNKNQEFSYNLIESAKKIKKRLEFKLLLKKEDSYGEKKNKYPKSAFKKSNFKKKNKKHVTFQDDTIRLNILNKISSKEQKVEDVSNLVTPESPDYLKGHFLISLISPVE